MDSKIKNQELFKKLITGLGISLSLFMSGKKLLILGFVIYYTFCRKNLTEKANILSLEQLDKLLNKIKNNVVHTLMVLYNNKHQYNPNEFIKRADDILIENHNENSGLKRYPSYDDKNEFLKNDRNLNLIQAKRTIDIILEIELKKLQQFGIDLKTYYRSLEAFRNEK
jgi:hypothetical protein